MSNQDLAQRFFERFKAKLNAQEGTINGVFFDEGKHVAWLNFQPHEYRVAKAADFIRVCDQEFDDGDDREAALVGISVSLEEFFNTEVGHVGAES